jgi:hypothetical protein
MQLITTNDIQDYSDDKRHKSRNSNSKQAVTYIEQPDGVTLDYMTDAYDLVELSAKALFAKMHYRFEAVSMTIEDAISESHTFMFSVFERKKFKGRSSLSTFVYSCLRNLFIGLTSKKRIEITSIDDLLESEYTNSETNELDEMHDMTNHRIAMLHTRHYFNKTDMKIIVAVFRMNSGIAKTFNTTHKYIKTLKQRFSLIYLEKLFELNALEK